MLCVLFHVSISPIPLCLAGRLYMCPRRVYTLAATPLPCVFTLTVCPLPMFTHLSPLLHSFVYPLALHGPPHACRCPSPTGVGLSVFPLRLGKAGSVCFGLSDAKYLIN